MLGPLISETFGRNMEDNLRKVCKMRLENGKDPSMTLEFSYDWGPKSINPDKIIKCLSVFKDTLGWIMYTGMDPRGTLYETEKEIDHKAAFDINDEGGGRAVRDRLTYITNGHPIHTQIEEQVFSKDPLFPKSDRSSQDKRASGPMVYKHPNFSHAKKGFGHI